MIQSYLSTLEKGKCNIIQWHVWWFVSKRRGGRYYMLIIIYNSAVNGPNCDTTVVTDASFVF